MVDRDEYWMFGTDDEEEYIPDPVQFKRAKASLVEKYPELPGIIEKFIADNSAEAHNRRRNSTAITNGVTLQDIKTHVLKNVPGLNTISKMTIHRMMKPSRQNTCNAKRHSGVVDARVPPKRNDANKDHIDFRFTCTNVNYVHELIQVFEDECAMLSCDDKNKINVGTMAVSRHFQVRKFFTTTDAPNYPDHDFPYPDSKLIPCGYMRLQTRRRTKSLYMQRHSIQRRRTRSFGDEARLNVQTTVTGGRERVSCPKSGPIDVFLQAARFHSSTSQTHVNHLFEILEPIVNDPLAPKSVISLLADGGPDWSTKSVANFMNFGRLWRDLCLDGLIILCYAPRHSRFNPIERVWGPLSKWLAGVTLPMGDLGKDVETFDNAIDVCAKYWCGKTYDGFPINVHKIPCQPSREPKYTDHNELKDFSKCTATQMRTKQNFRLLQTELSFLAKHSVRRSYQIEFFKCSDESCEHCRHHPVKATKFFNALSSLGGELPTPVTDSARIRGEHLTLLDILRNPESMSEGLDFGIPSGRFGVCQDGCRYVFLSKADEKRHKTLLHSVKRRR